MGAPVPRSAAVRWFAAVLQDVDGDVRATGRQILRVAQIGGAGRNRQHDRHPHADPDTEPPLDTGHGFVHADVHAAAAFGRSRDDGADGVAAATVLGPLDLCPRSGRHVQLA
jgi:hypothetical protein